MHHCVPKCFRLQWTLCTITSAFSLTGTFGAAQSLETVRKLSTKLNPEEGSKSTYFNEFVMKIFFPIMPSYKIIHWVEIVNKKY